MKRLKVIAVLAAYITTLLWAYVAIISPTFAYFGYKLYWPGPARLTWIIVLALAPAMFVPIRLSRPSLLVVWWLYVTVYIPSTLLPTLSLTLSFAELLPLEIVLLLSLGLMVLISSSKHLALRRLKIRSKVYWPGIFFVWASCLIFVLAHFNFSSLIFNLASLFFGGSEYTIRNGFSEQLSQAGKILVYATGQVGGAIDPFLIAYGLVYRRKILLIAGISGQLMIFAVLGSKSILFSTVFLVIVFVLMRSYRKNFGVALGAVLIAVVLLSAGADWLSKSILLSSITTRRTLMDPGLLTGFYYEHYSKVPHAGLAYHFPRGGEAVPAPSYEIGLVYFGDVHIDANANLWAEGFADFGMPGVIGFTLLLSAILWLYDSIAARRNMELAIMLVTMQAFDYSNAAPLTTFITHGGLASALLLWSAPSTQADAVMSGFELSQRGTGSKYMPAFFKRLCFGPGR